MGSKANEMTPLASQIMRECIRLQKASGMTVADFAKACGFSRDYWYKHANLSRPLNIGDLERISQVTGISPGDIVMNSQRHAVEAAERKAQAGGYGLAAYDAAGKQEAINERLGRITTSLPDLPIDRRMTYGAMRRAIIGLPVTVSSAILPDGLWGCYDASNSVILIDRRLTYTAKRCVLTHELLHWKHGDDGCANDRSKQERRCRTQTALLLVNPAELALLERMYEYESQIADELNVTTQVLEDYRSTLASA